MKFHNPFFHDLMTSESSNPILNARNLSREVEGISLVHNISLEIIQGEIVAIVGPSGSGKSSLLRLLNRLDEPTSGTVIFKGKDYRSYPPSELRRKIGMVMQQPNLFPGTVIDNLRFGPAQRGDHLPAEEVEQHLDLVNLHNYAQRDVSTLSGGEAQRVSLARTIANMPEVLLLDEPTSALDSDSKKSIEDLILTILERHQLTAVLVTHDQAQARRMADRTLSMKEGQITSIHRKEKNHAEDTV
jgi:putative ABC transport system ATP-binding protein